MRVDCENLEFGDEFLEDAVDELTDDVRRQSCQQVQLLLRRSRLLIRLALFTPDMFQVH